MVNKPVGISVQNEDDCPGLLPLLQQQTGEEKYWLVHRLDKVTSGILLLARNERAASELSQAFAKRQVQKFYLALSPKKPKKKQGMVAGDMKKVRDGKWLLVQSLNTPAISQFFSLSDGQGNRLFVLKPITGKTHQLRVALKSLGSPILGDNGYAGAPADRVYLHAYALAFQYQNEPFAFLCAPDSGEHFIKAAAAIAELPTPESFAWPSINPHLLSKILPVTHKELQS